MAEWNVAEKNGAWKGGKTVASTGLSQKCIGTALSTAKKSGLVRQISHGVWEINNG